MVPLNKAYEIVPVGWRPLLEQAYGWIDACGERYDIIEVRALRVLKVQVVFWIDDNTKGFERVQQFRRELNRIEQLSLKTCEECGCPGNIRSLGMEKIRVLCDDHKGF